MYYSTTFLERFMVLLDWSCTHSWWISIHFKACVRYFLSNFYFSLNDSPSKTMKNVFIFNQKSPFRSQDILIFVLPSSPLFLPVSHCFRSWSKINFKVYDIINCLNKNLITHFLWYFGKEKRYAIETLSIDRVFSKKYFLEKSCRKGAPKASLRSPFKFGK